MKGFLCFMLAVLLAAACTGCMFVPRERPPAGRETEKPAAETAAPLPPATYDGDGVRIVLPADAGIDGILPASDVEAITGETGYAFTLEQGEGIGTDSLIGYYQRNRIYNTGITVVLFLNADQALYEEILTSSEPETTVPLISEAWDQGVFAEFDDGTVGVVVRRAGTCIAFAWYPDGYPSFAGEELGTRLALRMICNLYGIDTSQMDVTGQTP